MPPVRCRYCGGSHPAWECKQRDAQPVAIDVAEARRVPAERAALREASRRAKAGLPMPVPVFAKPEEPVPWVQPPGVCPSCDRRRADNARRAMRHRERE